MTDLKYFPDYIVSSNPLIKFFLKYIFYVHQLCMIYTLVYRFCPRHGPEHVKKQTTPPADMLVVADAMMPRLLWRLVLHMRGQFDTGMSCIRWKVIIK